MEKNVLIKYYKKRSSLDMEKIISEYSNYVYTIIRNIVNNSIPNEDIEELISDVFIVIWNNKDKLQEDKPLSPYLAGVTRNIIKNKLKTVQITYSLEDLEIDLVNHFEIDDILAEKETSSIINDALQKMSPEVIKIFTMFYYSSKKIKDIAKDLQISEHKVKIELYRTRKKLKNILIESGYVYE